MEYTLVQRLIAEAIGTAILVGFGAGSVVAAIYLGEGELTYAGLGFVAIAFAIGIAVAVYAFGQVSGAHINPAVTFSLAVTGRFRWIEVIPYFVAQLIGGALGAFVILAAFGTEAADLGGVGGTVLAEDITYVNGIAAEAFGTFILVLTVMALAVDSRAPTGWAGLMIGLSVGCAILVIGPLTGSSLNPARTFGPYIATVVSGGDVAWSEFPLYWIGPLLGGAIAAFVYDLVARPRAAEAAATPADAAQ